LAKNPIILNISPINFSGQAGVKNYEKALQKGAKRTWGSYLRVPGLFALN
jgi:hypothetical protein